MTQSTERREYRDSLRASASDVREAREILARREAEGTYHDRRKSVRYLFDMPAPMQITLLQPGGAVGRFRAVPHNISDSGLGFLHGVFVHQGTRCGIVLTNADGKPVGMQGEITQATCLTGRVHFVGVRFDQPINALDFVKLKQTHGQPVVRDPELAVRAAKELGEFVLANATISELRAKYDELGQALFPDDV